MRAVLLDMMNIVSIIINGLWCMYAYYFGANTCDTYIYDHDNKLKLDYYRPPNGITPKGIILYAHGGGWIIGTRRNVPPGILELLKSGYSIASMSYRMLPQHHFPDPVDDVHRAHAWIGKNLETLSTPAVPIIGWGLSAGAQIINYTALKSPHLFVGVISWYGFSNLSLTHQNHHPITRVLIKKYLRDIEADAISLVSDKSPSFYIVHGGRDSFVNTSQSIDLYHQLSLAQNPSRLQIYPQFYHGDWRFNFQKNIEETKLFLDLIAAID